MGMQMDFRTFNGYVKKLENDCNLLISNIEQNPKTWTSKTDVLYGKISDLSHRLHDLANKNLHEDMRSLQVIEKERRDRLFKISELIGKSLDLTREIATGIFSKSKEIADGIDAHPETLLSEQEVPSFETHPPEYDETVTVNNDNLREVLCFAHKTGSGPLFQKCFDFIKNATNITLNFEDPSGPISIDIEQQNHDSEINGFYTYLQTLVDSVGPENIRINIQQGPNLSLENLKLFVNKASGAIHTLDLTRTVGPNHVSDDDLSDLLKNCSSLIDLSIKSDKITEKGIEELHRLNSLKTLQLSSCSNLSEITLPQEMRSLETLQVFDCPKLRELILPEGMELLRFLHVCECPISELTLPQGLRQLRTLRVMSCQISKLTLLQDMESLNVLHFWNCPKLRKFILPQKIRSLKSLRVEKCKTLTKLTLPEDVGLLKFLDVSGCPISEILLEEMRSLQSLAVSDCQTLTKLTLPKDMGSLQSLFIENTGLALTPSSELFLFLTRNPDNIQTLAVNPGLKPYSSIFNIAKIPENSEEPLEDKIEEFQSFISQSEKLSTLRSYLDDIKIKDPVEQLPLLRFIACIAGLMLTLPEEHIDFLLRPIFDETAPATSRGALTKDNLLYLIYDHKFIPHRYALISEAIKIAEEDPGKFDSIISKLKNNRTKLAALTLCAPKDESVMRILDRIDQNKDFRDNINFNLLLSFLCEGAKNLFSDPKISTSVLEELEETLQKKNTGNILKTLGAYESISVLFGKDALESCIKSKTDPQVYFSNKFSETFRLNTIENCVEKYKESFGKFRDPFALFAYSVRMKQLNASDRDVNKRFLEYVTSVLESNFHELRYDSSRSPHLQKIFDGEESNAAKEIWKTNIGEESLSGSGKTEAIDYRSIFYDKILNHNHLPNIDSFPGLKSFFEGDVSVLPETLFSIRKSFQEKVIKFCSSKKRNEEAWSTFMKTLNDELLKEIVPEALKDTLKATTGAVSSEELNKILREHLNFDDLPRLKYFLDTGRNNFSECSEVVRREFSDLLMELCSEKINPDAFLRQLQNREYASLELGELRNDINSLKPQEVQSKFTIMETDDPCDLLLIGTEIRSSCQRVDGYPGVNKCLVSYLMNGEIKAIVVKAGGKIVARSLIRLMWDSANNRRVIIQEAIYNNIVGNVDLENKINEWAKKKAKEMGCPLVSVDVGIGPPYAGKVECFEGFAPYTYSDASKGVKKGYFETLGCKTLWEPGTD